MKDVYYFFGGVILLQLGRIIYFFYQKWQIKKAKVEIADFRWETYLKLREQMLLITPAGLGIKSLGDTEIAFAVGLEIHTGVEVKIIILLQTREIWGLTTKNARKDIFNPKNEIFSSAMTSVLKTAQYNFARMQRKRTILPEPGYVSFYILTNNGIYSADSPIRDVISETSDWQELYIKINDALEQFKD